MAKYLSDNCYCCGDIITHGIYFETDVQNEATNHITKTSYVGVHESDLHQIGAPDYKTLFKFYISYEDADNSELHAHIEPISPITSSDIVVYLNDNETPEEALIFSVKMDDSITVHVSNLYQYSFYLKLEGGADALVRVSDLNNIIDNDNKLFVSPETTLPLHLEALRHAPSLIVSQQEDAFDGTEEEVQQQVETNCVAIAAVDSNSSQLAPYTVLASVEYVNTKIDDSGSGESVVNPVQYTSKRAETLWNTVAPDIAYKRAFHYKSCHSSCPSELPIDVVIQFNKQIFKKHDWSIDAILLSFDVSYQDRTSWNTKTATFNAWLSGFAELLGAGTDFYFNNPSWRFDNNNFQIHCHLDRVADTSTKVGNLGITNFSINYDQLSYISEEAKYKFNTLCLETPKLITNNLVLSSNNTLFLNNLPFIDTVRASASSDQHQISDFFKIHNCCEIRGPNDISNQSAFYQPGGSYYGVYEPIRIINNGRKNNFQFIDELCGNPYNYFTSTSSYTFHPDDYKFNKSIVLGAKDVNLPPSSIYSSSVGEDIYGGLTLSILPQAESSLADSYDQIDTKLTISSLVNDGDDISTLYPSITLTRKNIYPEEGGAYTPELHEDENIELFCGGYTDYHEPILGSLIIDSKQIKFSPYLNASDENTLHAVFDYTNKTLTCDFDIITPNPPSPTPTPTPTTDTVSRAEYNELLEQVKELKEIVQSLNAELFALKLNQN